MKIVIDGRMLYWTGVGRYTRALIEQLGQLDHENDYVVLMRKKDWSLWEPTRANFIKVEASFNPYTLAEQILLPFLLRRLKPDLVHFPAANTPLFWRGKRVVTIHDLTLLDYDTNRRTGWRASLWPLKRLAFRMVFWNDAHFASRVITDTQYVKQQIINRYHVKEDRVSVTWLAADPQMANPEPLDRLQIKSNYLLYIGNAFPYKNISATIRALAEMGEPYSDLQLVVAGKRDTFSTQQEQLARELGLGERVSFVGFISDGEMVSLYRRAQAYINPSLSEGFGLQGLEAMSHDTPVVAARASCLPEVYAEAAEYFDPGDPRDQARAIERVLSDKSLAGTLRKAGHERLKQFSWRQMAEKTLAVYRETS
jgi:glycosyltransferase involved in cell wall biosynthesis